MEKKLKKAKWSRQELDLLTELYPLHTSKRWKQITQIFKEKGFIRSEIECREKWINFLDPELNKSEWSKEELQKLYQIHDQVGTKWCVIQKYIGRTQNKIKNRFYGTLRNYIRFMLSHMQNSRQSYNYEIGKLSPNFLNDMYKAQNQFKFLNNEIRDAIFQMKFRVDRCILAERIKAKKTVYEKLKRMVYKAFPDQPQIKHPTKANQLNPKKEHNSLSEELNQESSSHSFVVIKEEPIEDFAENPIESVKSEVKEEIRAEQLVLNKNQQRDMMAQSFMPPPPFYPFWNYQFPGFGFWPQ